MPVARRVAAFAALAALPVAVFVAAYGLQDHYRFADEAIGIFGGRDVLERFPEALWDPDFSGRPLERGLAWLWALCLTVTSTTSASFQLMHVVLAVVAASAAIPIALLLRALGAGLVASVGAGVVAVLGPWSIFGVTLLNNAPGMTAVAWMLLAAQRAVLRPGWRSDALLLAAALLVGFVRAGNVAFAASVGPALLWAAWARGGSPAGFVRELVRRHWLLLGAAAVAALVLAARGVEGLLSSYGAGRSTYIPWDLLLPGLVDLGGHAAVAVGAIGLAFALPMLLRGVLRAASEAERAFALTGLTFLVLFAYVYAPALNEDRYFVALTPVVVVAAGFALAVRPLGLAWLAAGAAGLVALLRYGTDWPASPDNLIIVPASPWWQDVVLGRLHRLPAEEWLAPLGAGAVAVLAGVLLLRGSPKVRRWAGLSVLGAVLLYQAGGAWWVVDKWTDVRGRPDLTFDDRTFADRAIPDGREALLVRANPSGDPVLPFSWDEVIYFNDKVDAGTLDVTPQPVCCRGRHYPLDFDRATGAVTTPVVSDLVVQPLGPTFSLAAERTLAVGLSEGHRLDRVVMPARVAFSAVEVEPDGARLRVWPRNAPGTGGEPCLSGGGLAGIDAVRVDGRRAPLTRRGGRWTVALPDRERVELTLRNRFDQGPFDLRLGRC